MAIQGIIRGFANPANLAQNVVLVGRGAHYILLVDGRMRGEAHQHLDEASKAFDDEAQAYCTSDWVEVLVLASSNVGDCATVTQTGSMSYQPTEPLN